MSGTARVVVLKLGGSLRHDPSLAPWLEFAAEECAGRIVVVPGGGAHADAVRAEQAAAGFSDLEAHNRAVAAMARMAADFHALAPRLQPAGDAVAVRAVLARGHSALWTAHDARRDDPDATTHWGVTSDSLALLLAQRLGAPRLVVVKACRIDPALSWSELSRTGVLDACFAALATDAARSGLVISVAQRDHLQRVRALLADSQS